MSSIEPYEENCPLVVPRKECVQVDTFGCEIDKDGRSIEEQPIKVEEKILQTHSGVLPELCDSCPTQIKVCGYTHISLCDGFSNSIASQALYLEWVFIWSENASIPVPTMLTWT